MTHFARSAASGEQFQISRDGARAVITELAGGLRLFECDGVALTETYGDHDIPPGGAGILLAPWPNRIANGRWELNGKPQQLDITEPRLGNASHGLLRNTGYRLAERSESSVTLVGEIFPQHGYPFRLTHSATYAIDANRGLHVTQSLRNHSDHAAPFALGAHPYLRIGDVDTAELTLQVRAQTRLATDGKSIPTAALPVADQWDLRSGRRVGDLEIDAAYTDLTVTDGIWEQRLTAPDGRWVALWAEEEFQYVHIFVSTIFPGVARAVALEPMTAPANAFNSGDGLRWLAPDATFHASWGIHAEIATESSPQV